MAVQSKTSGAHTVIDRIGDNDPVGAVDGYTSRTVKLAVALTKSAESKEEISRGVKDLDTVIARVGHNDPVGAAYRYIPWTVKPGITKSA